MRQSYRSDLTDDQWEIIKTFDLEVINVNDRPVDLNLSNSSINENSSNGTIIGNLSTLDPDVGDTHSYKLTNNAGGRFILDGNQLLVAQGNKLNFEAYKNHLIRVKTTDTAGLSLTKNLIVNINDLNEAPVLGNDIATANTSNTKIIADCQLKQTTNPIQLQQLLITNWCVRCRLADADLAGADLAGANLREANLVNANLDGANLNSANLSGVELSWFDYDGGNGFGFSSSCNVGVSASLKKANLSGANLNNTDLSNIKLSGANLKGANLFGVDLSGANLDSVNLKRIDLTNANLSAANLKGANLNGVDLSSVDLSGVDLSNANLSRRSDSKRTENNC